MYYRKNGQEMWTVLEWGVDMDSHLTNAQVLSLLPHEAQGVYDTGLWESIFCCGRTDCPACRGHRDRRHSDERNRLQDRYPNGFAIKVESITSFAPINGERVERIRRRSRDVLNKSTDIRQILLVGQMLGVKLD